MPTFGHYETYGEPLAITEDRGHVSTVWRARKAGDQGDPNFAVKCYAPHRRQSPEGKPEDALDKDPAQEFLAGVKQLQKAYNEGARGIVPIHDVGFSDEGAWYVTNYYPRNTLKAWIARRGGVDSAALRQVVNGIVSGCLALKRARGFPHGNLKAANIFLVGKPRPLRSTPLHLADAYPAAPLQLARLGKEDRREADELLHQVMEVQDLRALGELLLQLVEGRHVTSAYDYNYPIASSPAWGNLGRDGERWRDLCNRLLDPQLTLDKLSLESLAKEYKPSGIAPHMPKILAGAGAVCLIAVGVYLGLQLVNQGRGERQKAEAAKIVLLVSESKAALDRNDFVTAISKSEEVLRLKPSSTEAAALKTQAGGKLEAEYLSVIGHAQTAMTAGKFDEVEKFAGRALALKAGDKAAGDLIKAAQGRRNAALSQAEQDRNFKQAMTAGTAALDKNDYVNAIKQAGVALGCRANDAAALKLKTDAEAGQKSVSAQVQRDENYTKAMTAGKAALARNEYAQVITEAERALSYRANDPAANTLRLDAQKKQAEAQTQVEQERNFKQAMAAGSTALKGNDLTNALKQAELALGYRATDKAALKLKTDAEAGLKNLAAQVERDENYKKAMAAGKAALERNEFAQTITEAERALTFRANDPAANTLKSAAQKKQTEAQSQAEQDRNYKQAMTAGDTALAKKDYAVALKQADVALGYRANDGAALKLRSGAETGQKDVAAQAERDEKYAKAMTAGNDALKNAKYAQAVTEAEIALTFRANDAAANTLKSAAQKKQAEVQSQAEREKNYGVAMEAATNALNRAEAAFNQLNYDAALRELNVSKSECDKAHGQKATAEVDQFKGLLEARFAAAQQGRDYRSATNDFARGNYTAALESCRKHSATDANFKALADKINTEQAAFTSATEKFSAGNYSYIAELDGGEYKAKTLFDDLLKKGRSEKKALDELTKARDDKNWKVVRQRFGELATEVQNKNPFKKINQWIGENDPDVRLQGNLEMRQAQFEVAGYKDTEVWKKTKPERLGRIDKEKHFLYVKELEDGFIQNGTLTVERQTVINGLRKKIENWND